MDTETSALFEFFRMSRDQQLPVTNLQAPIRFLQIMAILPKAVAIFEQYKLVNLADSRYAELRKWHENLSDPEYQQRIQIGEVEHYLAQYVKLVVPKFDIIHLQLMEEVHQAHVVFEFMRANQANWASTVEALQAQFSNQEYERGMIRHLQIAWNLMQPFIGKVLSYDQLLHSILQLEISNKKVFLIIAVCL